MGHDEGAFQEGQPVNFELDEDQIMLRDLIENFVAERYDLSRRLGYQAGVPGYSPDNWRKLGELGLLALPFSDEDGGLAGGAIELVTVMEVIGRALVAEPLIADLLLSGAVIARAGGEATKTAWLPRIMSGEARIGFAHFEAGARFNLAHVDTRATPDGDGVRLDGDKTLVLAGVGVDAYLVSARAAGTRMDGPIDFYLIPAGAAGLVVKPYRVVDGSMAVELRLQGVAASAGFSMSAAALDELVDKARLAASAEMIGIMAMLFDATLEYARTRRQFGVAIGSFQALQHRMADFYVLLEQSRSLMLRAALKAAEGADDRGAAIAAAKSFIADAAIRIGEGAIQLHGGIGISDELVIGHGHKRLLLLATLFGDSDAELRRYNRLVA